MPIPHHLLRHQKEGSRFIDFAIAHRISLDLKEQETKEGPVGVATTTISEDGASVTSYPCWACWCQTPLRHTHKDGEPPPLPSVAVVAFPILRREAIQMASGCYRCSTFLGTCPSQEQVTFVAQLRYQRRETSLLWTTFRPRVACLVPPPTLLHLLPLLGEAAHTSHVFPFVIQEPLLFEMRRFAHAPMLLERLRAEGPQKEAVTARLQALFGRSWGRLLRCQQHAGTSEERHTKAAWIASSVAGYARTQSPEGWVFLRRNRP
jgi:hypothetical protein